MSEAYEFLRNTEHAIQGYQDRQTQALPTDELGQLRLAWAMGFESWDAFFKGKSVEQGVYNYRITSKLYNGKQISKTGHVTVLR